MTELLVNLDVPDLEAATAFYTQAFGLRVGRRFGTSAVELLGAAVPLYLLPKAEGTSAFGEHGQPRSYQRHWTPVHLDFIVKQLDVAISRATSVGAKLEGAVSEHAWGRMALFSDPFGHGFCLLELSERGYDAIADAEGP